MPHTISEECIACGNCVSSCPTGAIKQVDEKYVISEECIDCGACVEQCPVQAIKPGA